MSVKKNPADQPQDNPGDNPGPKKFPTPGELQKEFEDFFKNRFGGNIQVVAQPMMGAQPAAQEEPENPESAEASENFDLDFNYKPQDIKAYLDRYVIKQDEAKKAIAIAVCDHYNHVKRCHENPEDSLENYSKQNVLMLGPTGVGKTYLVKLIAKLVGVPFVKADATRFTETGYVGANVDDLIRDLVTQADGNIELAQYGIIYLDEADKLASPNNISGRDVSGRGVQIGLLKLMEETEVDLSSGNDMASQLQSFMDFQKGGKISKKIINTRDILFIVSGAFTGLDEIIGKRLNRRAMGLVKDASNTIKEDDELLTEVTSKDLVDFGFEPEFIGRLPIRVSCQHLNEDDLYEILKSSEGSLIHQYHQAFESYGIDVRFTEKGLKKIAELGAGEKTGARALMTVLEKTLRDFKFELPSTTLKKLAINEELVINPKKYLKELLEKIKNHRAKSYEKDAREFEKGFLNSYGLKIHFTEDALGEISALMDLKGKGFGVLTKEILSSYEHGLNLIRQNTGKEEFQIDSQVIRCPEKTLERWIRESYSNLH